MIRVHRHQSKKKLAKLHHSTMPPDAATKQEAAFKTPQSFGRAHSKVKKALPFSPRKRKAIVIKLACVVGTIPGQTTSSNKKLPDATVTCVNKYFLLDSVSRQAPGMKDYVTVRSGGKKAKLQKRHLTCSLKEKYALFKRDHPTVKISFSKFCSLRPANVLLSSTIPRNVCLCQHHDNVKLLCEAIHKAVPEFPPYSSETVSHFVCSAEEEKCMTGVCDKCPNWMEEVKAVSPLDDPVEWYQWERVEKAVPGKKGKPSKTKKKIQKVVKEGTVDEAISTLHQKLPAFLHHVFVKRKQSRFFEEKMSNLSPDVRLLFRSTLQKTTFVLVSLSR